MRKSSLLPVLFGAALAAGILSRLGAGAPDPAVRADLVHVFPFGLMGEVRDPSRTVTMQVQVYNEGTEPISLHGLRAASAAGAPLAQVELHGERLEGDGGELAAAHVLLETIDPELSHRHHSRVFIAEEQRPKLSPAEEATLVDVLLQKVERIQQGGGYQFRNLPFTVDLGRLFAAGARPGDEAVLDVVLDYRDASGAARSKTISHTVRLLAPYLGPPAGWGQGRAGAWHAGDMHVHNCRDQASGGCPDCAAESFNLTGSFTNAALKGQFQALGMSFFSTTTHSYCVTNDTEFLDIQNESVTLDDAGFQVICGTEVSTRETGPQSGTDLFDAVCTLGGQFFVGTAHMGAHFISARKPGGGDRFLGTCDAPLFPQDTLVDAVKAEGGLVNANHPAGTTLSFNSVAFFEGLERGGAFGTEIWNGGGGQASGDHRSWWLARLNQGKITYPWSGSDTHDAAFDFGAMHTWVEGALTDASLRAALASGRTYISNGPFLETVLSDNFGHSLPMGGTIVVKAAQIPPNFPVNLDVAYDLGSGVGRVQVYAGSVGAGDALVQEFTGLTGSGVVTATTTVPTTGHSWYRAEAHVDGQPLTAYSTPTFIGLR